jgi:hypothetical protein
VERSEDKGGVGGRGGEEKKRNSGQTANGQTAFLDGKRRNRSPLALSLF